MTLDIKLRLATKNDSNLLLSWRNDPVTVNSSINTNPISQEEHNLWLSNVLLNSDIRLYIIEYNGLPAGNLRQQREHNNLIVSWTTAPEFRGLGIATAALTALMNTNPSAALVAKIKVNNYASIKVAEKAGLIFSHKADGLLYYIRETT